MRIGPRPAVLAAASIAMLFGLLPSQASAGLFDFLDVFGESYPQPSVIGRQLVAFPADIKPGTIIVRFSQRRLYFVLPKQMALSYPIGAPTGEALWQGDTYVSEKRINPVWTPTAEMRRENPTLPPYVPGGDPPIRWASGPCISATPPIGSTAPMRLGQWATRSLTAAFACSMRTSPISINACPSEPVLLFGGKGLVKTNQRFAKVEAKNGEFAGFCSSAISSLFT
jgi:hypothetical protein